MAGYPNQALAAKVAKLLKKKDWQESSDNALAREVGCSRTFVRVVRAKLIAHGEIPPPSTAYNNQYEPYPNRPIHIRGGYILDHLTGEVMKEVDYIKKRGKLPK